MADPTLSPVNNQTSPNLLAYVQQRDPTQLPGLLDNPTGTRTLFGTPSDGFFRSPSPTVFELARANADNRASHNPIPERQVSSATGYPDIQVPVPGYDRPGAGLTITGGFMEPHGHSQKPTTYAIFGSDPNRVVTLPPSDRNLGIDFVPHNPDGSVDRNVRAWWSGQITRIQSDPVFGGSGAEGYGRRVEMQTDRTIQVRGTDGVVRDLPVMVGFGHLAGFQNGLAVGQRIEAGDILGRMGGAGRGGDGQYSPHVDMRVYVNDPTRGRVDVSPNVLLNQAVTPNPQPNPTPTPNPTTTPTPTPTPSASSYTVRAGDTLSQIAADHGVSLERLLAANPQIRNPDVIDIGQRINLPTGAASKYTVQAGDTLSGIAARQGVSLERLLAANPQIANPNLIFPGQTINVPRGASTQPNPTRPTNPTNPTNPVDPNPAPRPFDGNLIYADRVSPEFAQKVVQIAERLGTDPNYLMAIMNFETGGTFDPAEPNRAGSGATGLIQFMPSTARGLGTTTAELARMSAVDQLDYVERYFEPYRGDLDTIEDAYLAVFYPAAIGTAPDHVIFNRGTIGYRQNAGLDANGDGQITKAEVGAAARNSYQQGLARLDR